MDRTARIVLLNGVGSVGTSSIAKAVQVITRDVFLHVQMDAFFDMLPAASIGHPDVLTFETIQDGDHPSVIFRSGPLAQRAFRGMRHAAAAMAAQGNDLIVDEVLLGETWTEHARLLAPFQLFLVGSPPPHLAGGGKGEGDRRAATPPPPTPSRKGGGELWKPPVSAPCRTHSRRVNEPVVIG